MDLERAFDERMDAERQHLAGVDWQKAQARTQVLEQMAQTFYNDMQRRMESFFSSSSGEAPANSYG